ncbi:hypothetical protein [Embleya sp. NPDC020630]|uniref:hypothetical protein n=1 Tax=Embleya sp. NPDC020630 TaxID=3363979 RepID=UPI0037BBFD00
MPRPWALFVNGGRRIGYGGGDPGITANVHSLPDADRVALFVAHRSLVALRPLIELPDRLILAVTRMPQGRA